MFKLFAQARKVIGKAARRLVLSGSVLALAACDLPIGPVTGGALTEKGAIQVALLVPYGSPTPGDDGLARSLENAARLASRDLGGQAVQIKVYPTAGQASQAAAAADRAIDEGADIILGPLRSDAANAAAVQVRGDGVNVLSFSNNADIAGGNLYVLGNTFNNISNRLMRYASATGRNRIVVVHPRTPVGQIAKSAITRAAAGTNVTIVGDGSFEFTNEGIVAAAPAIAQTVQSTGATGIMLTSDSAGALPFLAQLLPEQGISPANIKYMGLARWDVPPQTLNLSGLQGGWFAVPDPSLRAQFGARYQSVYGNSPHPLAGLAYDGIAAVGALIGNKRDLSGGNLTQRSGFAGVNGIFRFNADGTAERAMAIAQVNNGQVQIIDPAPKSFSAGGF